MNGSSDVKKDNKWGFIDVTGKIIVPLVYENVTVFIDGLAGVEKEGKWGFVNEEGKEIIPCVYDWIEGAFQYGFAKVLKNLNKRGFIDKNGKEYFGKSAEEIEYFINVTRIKGEIEK